MNQLIIFVVRIVIVLIMSVPVVAKAADIDQPAQATSLNSPVVAILSLSPEAVAFTSEKTRVDIQVNISITGWSNAYNTLKFECKDSTNQIVGFNSISITTSVNYQINIGAMSNCTFSSPGTYRLDSHLLTETGETSNTDSKEIIVN